MTIASEIQRLQWAKSDMQISIWNKWVIVPNSAKLDEYAWYIDQIQTWVPQEDYDAVKWVVNGLQLYPYRVTSEPRPPSVFWLYSFFQDGVPYWCVLSRDSWYDDSYDRLFVCFRKRSGYDIEYLTVWAWSSNSGTINEIQCRKTDTSLRYFFTYTYVNNPYTWNVSYFLVQMDWVFSTWANPVLTSTTQWPSTRISDYTIDTTGYTQYTTSDWVQSVWTREWDDEWYIYLILWDPTP